MTEAAFSAESVTGVVTIPGSKSYTQRYILLSAFSGVPVKISNPSGSADERVAAGIAQQCGSEVELTDDSILVNPDFRCPDTIYAGESATSFRLSLALLAGKKCRTSISMSESLRKRSSKALTDELAAHGASIREIETGLFVDGTSFHPGKLAISGRQSSQFTSALIMLQAVMGPSGAEIEVSGRAVSGGYVEITIECLRHMGIEVSRDGNTYRTSGEFLRDRIEAEAETDMSSLSVFLTLGVLCSTGGITIRQVRSSGKQPDHEYTDILRSAGFNVTADWDSGTLKAKKSSGNHITVDADRTPDLCVIASVIGIFSVSGVTILNSERLSGKESDRRRSIADLARSFGAEVTDDGGNIEIRNVGRTLRPASLQYKDHRMVMAAAVAAVASGSETRVGDLGALHKSYPFFLDTLALVGISFRSTG